MAVMTYREALNLALREEMRRDPRVFVMGEEVGLYDGAYKVTQGLLKEFGDKRIIDTPICESGFTGVGVGVRDAGAPAGGRDDDVQLLDPGARPDRQLGGQDVLHVRRAVQHSTGHPRARRPGGPAGRAALAVHGDVLLPRARAQGGAALDARRRQGAAEVGHPRRQSRDLHRGRDAVRGQGRGAGGSGLPDPARQGGDPARGHRRHGGGLHGHDVPRPRGRGGAGQGRDLGGDRGSADAPADGHRDHHRVRPEDASRGGAGGGRGLRGHGLGDRGPDHRDRLRRSRRAGRCGSPARTRRCPTRRTSSCSRRRRRPRSRRRSARCATHDHQGVHAEAVRRHGDRQGHQVAEEGRRRDQGR